jgi:DNA-binding NtrC family response regulator
MKKIALIDDHEEILNLIEIFIGKTYEIVKYTNPKKFVDDYLSEDNIDIDMIITDNVMKEMSGIELIKLFKEKHPTLPILLCTGWINELDRKFDKMDLIIEKPFSGKKLLNKIDRIFNDDKSK